MRNKIIDIAVDDVVFNAKGRPWKTRIGAQRAADKLRDRGAVVERRYGTKFREAGWIVVLRHEEDGHWTWDEAKRTPVERRKLCRQCGAPTLKWSLRERKYHCTSCGFEAIPKPKKVKRGYLTVCVPFKGPAFSFVAKHSTVGIQRLADRDPMFGMMCKYDRELIPKYAIRVWDFPAVTQEEMKAGLKSARQSAREWVTTTRNERREQEKQEMKKSNNKKVVIRKKTAMKKDATPNGIRVHDHVSVVQDGSEYRGRVEAIDSTGKKAIVSFEEYENEELLIANLNKLGIAGRGKPGPRPKGVHTKLGVIATWAHLFEINEKSKHPDEWITDQMNRNFPGRNSAVFNHVQRVRREYNSGKLLGKKPRRQSHRYDEDGNDITPKRSKTAK